MVLGRMMALTMLWLMLAIAAYAQAACPLGCGTATTSSTPALEDTSMRHMCCRDNGACKEEPRTINVTGTAEMRVAPDLGVVIIAVESQQPTVAAATQQNTAVSTKLQQAITGLNIPNLTIRTLDFDVQPVYEQPASNATRPMTPRIVAYRVVNRIEVRVPDANTSRLSSHVGRVLEAALTAGANRVDSLQFTLADPQAAMQPVIAMATKHARQTAMTIAEAAGITLGKARNFSVTPYMPGPPQPMAMYARSAMAEMAPPIEAGTLQLQATVNATYEMQ